MEAAVKQERSFTIIGREILTDRQIDIRAKKFADLDAAIKAMEKERDALKAEIIAGMGSAERVTGHYKVANTEYSTSRFDGKAFKAEHPEMFSVYNKITITSRFSLKAI